MRLLFRNIVNIFRKGSTVYFVLSSGARKWDRKYVIFADFNILLHRLDLFLFVFPVLVDKIGIPQYVILFLAQSLHNIGDKMGLPFNLHIHLGRHTYAMMALNGGVDIKTTSSMLGHASTMVTEKVYATLLPNTIAEIVGDKLNVQLD